MRRKESMKKKGNIVFGNKAKKTGISGQDLLKEAPIVCPPFTKVLFKEMPEGKILITGFEGFLSGKDIKDKFGEDVLDCYLGYPVYMLRGMCQDDELIVIHGDGEPFTVYSGKLLNQDKFNTLIGMIKKCGELLHEIRYSLANNPDKKIRI
jgi:hypothetical protein